MRRLNLFRITFLLVLSLVCVNIKSYAQELSSAQIDQLVEGTMKIFDVPGIAVGIVKDGELIHARGYGIRSLNEKGKVDEHTLFAIASNSKAFTAAALGILVDEKKLSWDDKVIDYIPEFRLYNPWVTEEFTIRDLLTHRSGLRLGAGDLMVFPDGSDFTTQELIYNLRYLKPVSSFRSKYDYDNLLYIVAGEVVARVSGRTWSEFVEERIMKPLGMERSTGNFQRLKDRSNLADPHAPIDGQLQVVDRYDQPIISAAGGIYSSISDMSKWVKLQLNQGQYGPVESQKLFSVAVHQEMWAPQTILPVHSGGSYNNHFRAYGLGWALADVNGYKQVSHTGGLPGMVTQVTLLPELNLGIIVLTNQQSGAAFMAISNQIKDSYLGITGTDRVKEYYERVTGYQARAKQITDQVWQEVAKKQKDVVMQKINWDAFAGTYKDDWFGEVKISKTRDGLEFVSKRSPKLKGEMSSYKGNCFIVKWYDRSLDADAYVIFQLDEEGLAFGIKMKAISPLTDFSYDFQDLDFRKIDE